MFVSYVVGSALAALVAADPLEIAPACDRTLCEIRMDVVKVAIPMHVGSAADSTLTMLPETKFETRGFVAKGAPTNGPMGPTLRALPGETLRVKLTNGLAPIDNIALTPSKPGPNGYMQPNSTNIHVHGLHVSAYSSNPYAEGDNVFVHLEPGKEQLYEYEIPQDHMPGTHLYHPHLHGSTAIQVGGGASGIVIIEDPPGTLPAQIEAMEEYPILLSPMDLPQLTDIQQRFRGNTDLLMPDPPLESNDGGVRVLTNGQLQPTLRLEAGKWVRLRIATVSIETGFVLAPVMESGACEMELLAKDGVYLNDLPRPVDYLAVFSANRADVAFRCEAGSAGYFGGVMPPIAVSYTEPRNMYVGPLLHIEVGPSSAASIDPPIDHFEVPVPTYLKDTRALVPDQYTLARMDAFIEGRVIDQEYYINYREWVSVDEPPVDTFVQGSLVEMYIDGPLVGQAGHVAHLHMSPFQIISNTFNTSGHLGYQTANPEWYDFLSHYFQVGDWHDTITEEWMRYGYPFSNYSLLGDGQGGFQEYPIQNFTVRFTPEFLGLMPIHCHVLRHEDWGMMGVYNIIPPPSALDEPRYNTLLDAFSGRPWAFNLQAVGAISLTAFALVVFGSNRRSKLRADQPPTYGSFSFPSTKNNAPV